jgi:hypothetical protein
VLRADGAYGTGEQGLVGLMHSFVTFRLSGYGGKFADLFKTLRRQLPARIAINARGIHEEVTWDVAIKTLLSIGHP